MSWNGFETFIFVKTADSPTTRDPAIVDACHASDRRRHELQLGHVDVGQILENFGHFRTLNGNQASVLLELEGDVQPLTENKKNLNDMFIIWCWTIILYYH